jgi:hypothetical protein
LKRDPPRIPPCTRSGVPIGVRGKLGWGLHMLMRDSRHRNILRAQRLSQHPHGGGAICTYAALEAELFGSEDANVHMVLAPEILPAPWCKSGPRYGPRGKRRYCGASKWVRRRCRMEKISRNLPAAVPLAARESRGRMRTSSHVHRSPRVRRECWKRWAPRRGEPRIRHAMMRCGFLKPSADS